jgi:hypothetical protein
MTAKVMRSKRIPEPQGDETIPKTWSAHVIAINIASISQMPYFFRNAGTGRFTPTSFCMKSDNVAKGQIAHQNLPRKRKTIGIRGHHKTHMRAVPGLSCALLGPARSSYPMRPNTAATGI